MISLAKKKSVDATEGPIFSKMVAFVIPLMLTNLMQQLYSMADSMVVGKFSGDTEALAAIGSTSTFIALVTALFTGFAAGASVVASRAFGARDKEGLSKATHTSVCFGFIVGVCLCALALLVSEPMLELLETKEILMPKALIYVRIVFIGTPAIATYNFGAAVLRSVGDSRTPFYTLTASGILNVVLNFVFVVGFGMSVEGVATGTVASQYLSAIVVIIVLVKRKDEAYGLNPKKLKIDNRTLQIILKMGIPAAIQGALFGITNLFLIRALNDFPVPVLSARTIATSIDVLLSTAMNTYLHVAMTFTGQNLGAGKPDRIKKSLLIALAQVVTIGVVVGQIMLLFYEPLCGLYISAGDPDREAVLAAAKTIMTVMLSSYFIGATNEVLSGFLRGLGYSLQPMLVSIGGICVFRLIWINFVFPRIGELWSLYLVYPISWTITSLGLLAVILAVWKRVKQKIQIMKQI
ncbi:MAG: MATE family efflux transporter [Clostridia bacterium]|nr:MATE family efflux transporter [Clostridia bacterium]